MSGAESDPAGKDTRNKLSFAVYSALMDPMSGIVNTALEISVVKHNERSFSEMLCTETEQNASVVQKGDQGK